ncbi:ammonia-dependent NAD(+) synthetase [Candidatus Saccharibacteria bacterium]|nr:ammonia-dependent NAD(+) synthetase [Candidatus Saccharibacteria bacterium]
MRTQQRSIIAELGTTPHINPEQEVAQRTQFLADYLGQTGMNGFVLGISGGQDSLLAGILAQRAVEARRSTGNSSEFHAVLLPYGTQADRKDALKALEVIKPDYTHDLPITAPTDAFVTAYSTAVHEQLRDFHKGNVKARMRMIAQYAIAGQYSLLVIGTDHAAEAVTGFYTKYGDGGADVLPLSGLTKRQGRQILEYLNVPHIFTQKAPTADLLDNTPSQPDETELGLSYNVIDDYLEGKQIDPSQAKLLEAKYAATIHKRTMPVAYSPPAPIG